MISMQNSLMLVAGLVVEVDSAANHGWGGWPCMAARHRAAPTIFPVSPEDENNFISPEVSALRVVWNDVQIQTINATSVFKLIHFQCDPVCMFF